MLFAMVETKLDLGLDIGGQMQKVKILLSAIQLRPVWALLKMITSHRELAFKLIRAYYAPSAKRTM